MSKRATPPLIWRPVRKCARISLVWYNRCFNELSVHTSVCENRIALFLRFFRTAFRFRTDLPPHAFRFIFLVKPIDVIFPDGHIIHIHSYSRMFYMTFISHIHRDFNRRIHINVFIHLPSSEILFKNGTIEVYLIIRPHNTVWLGIRYIISKQPSVNSALYFGQKNFSKNHMSLILKSHLHRFCFTRHAIERT